MTQRKKLKKGEITRKDIIEGKQKGLEKKLNKVILTPIYRDENGNKFYHYCNYRWHRGRIYQKKYEDKNCNQCKHYAKIYPNKHSQ